MVTQPYFMSNEEWYTVNENGEYVLTDKAPQKAVEDYNEYKNEYIKKVKGKTIDEYLDFLVSEINSSVLLVWGNKDNSTKLYMYKKLLKGLHNVKGVIINGDHFAYLKNKNKCMKLIYNFDTRTLYTLPNNT